MIDLVQRYITGRGAVKIASGIEAALRDRRLGPGERLPTVRRLAAALEVSPATVAAAYRQLQERGLIQTDGRRGTRISHRLLSGRQRPAMPAGVRNLHDGNPDPALLPDLAPALRRVDPAPCLYGVPPNEPRLAGLVGRDLERDGVRVGALCVVNGAMDGIDRVLAEWLRPGDRIAVEDPGFTGHLDLVAARRLTPLPVGMDEEGPLPDDLETACRAGAAAFLVTPRAQSPTGAALSETRARDLRRVLAAHPDVLIVEDDHANRIADAPLHCLHHARRARWAHLHSLSKSINPDLRIALLTGDATTTTRVQERLVTAERWVSHIVQRLAAELLADRAVHAALRKATATYARRRAALVEALRAHGLPAIGRCGYNVWLPVPEETPTVQALAAAGWGVSAGERFRLASGPGVRITASTLEPRDAVRVARDAAEALDRPVIPAV